MELVGAQDDLVGGMTSIYHRSWFNLGDKKMFLSELMSLLVVGHGQVELRVPPDWMQGRSAFGGLQAAVALASMRTLVPDMPLRTLQATFMAPMQGDKLAAKAIVLRAGKNTLHVEARLMEGDETLGVVIAVFGNGRSSGIARTLQQPVVDTSEARTFPYLPGLTPTFTQYFNAEWLRGGFPFSNNPLPEIVARVGMHDQGMTTEAHVLALADFIPPVALSGLSKPAAGSTLTWMIEFLSSELEGLPLEGWRIDAEMLAARDGYTSQSVTLWNPAGEAVALSRQSMVVFG